MGNLYHILLYQPLFNGLMALHRFIPGHDLGLAIILLTFVIKLILFWPSLSSLKSQRQLQEIQPKLKALQEKYKSDRQELGRQTMKLYREHKVSPLSSCLPLILQLVILIPLYRAFISGLKTDPTTHLLVADQVKYLYDGLRMYYETTAINLTSFGFLNLGAKGGIIIGIVAGALQFFQARMLTTKAQPKVPGAKDESTVANVNRQMMYIFPLLTIYLTATFPAGLGVYWIASTLFQIAQQWYFLKRHAKSAPPSAGTPAEPPKPLPAPTS